MAEVLLYVRPWNLAQFQDLAIKTWPGRTMETLSEHHGCDSSGFRELFYSFFKDCERTPALVEKLPFQDEDIEDIIRRCRLLSSINRPRALKMIFSAFRAIERVLDDFKPRYVMSVTVDSFIIDLLARVSRMKEVRFLGLVTTFVNGYFRITERGEKAVDREVPADEVQAVLSMLTNQDYKPRWLAADRSMIRKKAFKLWARNSVKPMWFSLYSRWKNDPLNAHYMTTDIVSRRYLSLFPRLYNEIGNLADVEQAIKNDARVSVFLPLQMSPEATIDYWSSDLSWIDYENKILSTVRAQSEKYLFIVKEHPNVFGFRTPGFYNELRKIRNLLLVNPEVSSNQLLQICDSVLVCTGTVGFEALLRGKPVFSSAKPFYAEADRFGVLGDTFTHCSLGDPRDLVEYLLSGFLPGTFINDGSWSESRHSSYGYNSLVAKSLRCYIEW